jgi:hypothetical protein
MWKRRRFSHPEGKEQMQARHVNNNNGLREKGTNMGEASIKYLQLHSPMQYTIPSTSPSKPHPHHCATPNLSHQPLPNFPIPTIPSRSKAIPRQPHQS